MPRPTPVPITAPRPVSARLARFPSTIPAITSHGAVPTTSSNACDRLPLERGASRAQAGGDDRPAEAQPGCAGNEDARELEHPVRRHEIDEADAVPGLSHQPADHPELQAVVEESEGGRDPAGDPAGERHERDLDVVREDLAREGGLLSRRHVVPRVTRLERRPELLRDDAGRSRRVVDAPERRERGGAEEEDERDEQRLAPSGDEPPVVGDEEADDRAAPGAARRRRPAGPGARALRAAPSPPLAEHGGAVARDPPPRRGRGPRAAGAAPARVAPDGASPRAGAARARASPSFARR